MAAFDCDKGFITKLLQTKDMTAVKEAQIRPDFFSGDSRPAYQYIYDMVMSTGEVPTVRAFSRKFPSYKLDTVYDSEVDDEIVGTEENLAYWCQELRAKVKQNTFAEAVESMAENLQEFDVEEAMLCARRVLSYIDSEVAETSDIDITKNTEDRKAVYLDRKKNKGMRGIPTGIRHLDYILKGLEDATLTTLIANTGVGKTWFEILVGAYCQLQNYSVLQFVTEMSEEIMRDRYEAMLYHFCYGEFNYEKFKSGTLSLKTERNYYKFLEDDLPNMEPLPVVTAMGVMSISAAIDKYKPDLVLIDGVYLMEDDQGAKDDWLRVAHITRDLKKLAKRAKIPILINTQADKNTSKKTGPGLDSIMYTQAIGQDSDNVLGMYRDDIMREDDEMCIRVLKQREGTLGNVMMQWDFNTMDFHEIFAENSNDEVMEDGSDEENDKPIKKNSKSPTNSAPKGGHSKNTLKMDDDLDDE